MGRIAKPTKICGPEEFRRVFNVSRETLSALKLYAELLRKWQKAVNLVASSTLDDVWHRHIGDSAQIVDILLQGDSPPDGGLWLDLGSGGGFPGLVAAIMLSEGFDYRFHLVESHGRKCAFLADVARQTGISIKIHNSRIEDLSLPVAGIVSARALAPLDRLLELSDSFADRETRLFFLKGRETSRELEQARKIWNLSYRTHNSITSSNSFILEITDRQKIASVAGSSKQ